MKSVEICSAFFSGGDLYHQKCKTLMFFMDDLSRALGKGFL